MRWKGVQRIQYSASPGTRSPAPGSIAPAGAGCNALLGSRFGCYSTLVTFTIELDHEDDGRWIAEVPDLSGVLCYGRDRNEAVARVQALALRVIAERLEHGEAPPELLNVSFRAA
jgi:predicted RNase H-like HicB family nuclease